MSHQSRLTSYILLNQLLIFILFVWNVIFYRVTITPLYMCATQTTLNRLKQPKNFYSEGVTYSKQWYLTMQHSPEDLGSWVPHLQLQLVSLTVHTLSASMKLCHIGSHLKITCYTPCTCRRWSFLLLLSVWPVVHNAFNVNSLTVWHNTGMLRKESVAKDKIRKTELTG